MNELRFPLRGLCSCVAMPSMKVAMKAKGNAKPNAKPKASAKSKPTQIVKAEAFVPDNSGANLDFEPNTKEQQSCWKKHFDLQDNAIKEFGRDLEKKGRRVCLHMCAWCSC